MPVYKLGVNYDGENKVDGIGCLTIKPARYRPELYPNSRVYKGDNLEICIRDQQPEPFFPIPDYLSVFIIKVEES
jgi:hypothetical protein